MFNLSRRVALQADWSLLVGFFPGRSGRQGRRGLGGPGAAAGAGVAGAGAGVSGAGGFWQSMQVLHFTVKMALTRSARGCLQQSPPQPASQPQALLTSTGLLAAGRHRRQRATTATLDDVAQGLLAAASLLATASLLAAGGSRAQTGRGRSTAGGLRTGRDEAQQAGAGAQQAGFAQQAGSGAAQAFTAPRPRRRRSACIQTGLSDLQNRSLTGVMGVQQVPQPQPQPAALSHAAGFDSKRVPAHSTHLNPWLQRATLNSSTPNMILVLIQQQLLYKELLTLFPGAAAANAESPSRETIRRASAGSPMGQNRLRRVCRSQFNPGMRGSATVRTVTASGTVEPFHDSNRTPFGS